MNRKMYQIVELSETLMHAGSKATSDVTEILSQIGVESLEIMTIPGSKNPIRKVARQLSYLNQWKRVCQKIDSESILFLQNPFYHNQFGRFTQLMNLKKNKNIKVISLVHDVSELRGSFDSKYFEIEFSQMLELADVLIVHNENMKKWFIEYGVSEDRLIVLEIFDYLTDKPLAVASSLEKVVTVAGNLSKEKSPFVYKLHQLPDLDVNLYGVNYEKEIISDNISYKGAFPSDQVPYELNAGFGLVWDGDSLDTCSGSTGNYLRFNNPHKLSLYLASGIPVIMWADSAEANFVIENNVGFVVTSLSEINGILDSLTLEDYLEYQNNAIYIGHRLQEGYYTKNTIDSILAIIDK
ncbi:TPA: sugar transferase [Streptococcus suis]